MSVFPDIYEQTYLTELIRREVEALATQGTGGEDRDSYWASRIMPLKPVQSRYVKIRVKDILPVGMAPFVAPGATPPLWSHKNALTERVVELVDIKEMWRMDQEDLLALESQDPRIVDDMETTIVDRGAMLQRRNDLRTEWMRWEALKDTLICTFGDDDAPLAVSYGIPAEHFPAVSTAWTSVGSADPIEDLWALSAVTLPASGVYANLFHLNSNVYRLLQRNTKIQEILSTYGRSTMLPNDQDLQDLLRDNTQQIIRVDAGYLNEISNGIPGDKTLTKWIEDDRVFATVNGYTYNNHPIADMADGWVLVANPGGPRPLGKQGMQSEMVTDKDISMQVYQRQSSSRMPRIYAPEVLAWLDLTP